MRRHNSGLAIFLAMMTAGYPALAQHGARHRIAPAIAPSVPSSLAARQPLIVYRSYPVYVGASTYQRASTPSSAAPVRGPYLTGPGQWVPKGAQAEAMALQWEPGDTRATPAAASGHWDWKRASLAELVELARRNKADRSADQD